MTPIVNTLELLQSCTEPMKFIHITYRQTSIISHTKFQNLNVSHLVLQFIEA